METMTLSQMRTIYPDEWVLVGNPLLDDPELQTTIISQLISGVVLYHSKDKRELAYNARDIAKTFENITLIYTGEIPKGRKFWL